MIEFRVDDKAFYLSSMVESSNNQLSLTSATLSTELNTSGTFEFIIPSSNIFYSFFKKMKSIITILENGIEIWRGRIIDERKDFYGTKTITCEGELSFLNDILVDKFDYSSSGISIEDFFTSMMNSYSSNCSDYRKILKGNLEISEPKTLIYPSSSGYSSISSALTTNLIDKFGGYLFLRRNGSTSYLDYISGENLTKNESQYIRFGENMLDLSQYINGANVFTYLYPVGKDNLDISSVNGGVKYIYSSEGEELFGRIDRSINFDDISSASNLLSKAKESLNQAITEAITIEISAVDLNLLNSNLKSLKVGDLIRVISPPHEVDSYFLCSKVVRDFFSPSNNEYTLGVDTTSITGDQADGDKKYDYSVEFIKDVSDKTSKNLNSIGEINIDLTTIKENYSSLDLRVQALEEIIGGNLNG